MNELEAFLKKEKRVWYNSIDLLRKFGREQLNELYKAEKIEIHQGLNNKVIRYGK